MDRNAETPEQPKKTSMFSPLHDDGSDEAFAAPMRRLPTELLLIIFNDYLRNTFQYLRFRGALQRIKPLTVKPEVRQSLDTFIYYHLLKQMEFIREVLNREPIPAVPLTWANLDDVRFYYFRRRSENTMHRLDYYYYYLLNASKIVDKTVCFHDPLFWEQSDRDHFDMCKKTTSMEYFIGLQLKEHAERFGSQLDMSIVFNMGVL